MTTKSFNLQTALNKTEKVVSRNGNRVVVFAVQGNKVIANVFPISKINQNPTIMKFNMDGTLYGPHFEHPNDLFMVA